MCWLDEGDGWPPEAWLLAADTTVERTGGSEADDGPLPAAVPSKATLSATPGLCKATWARPGPTSEVSCKEGEMS